MAIFDLVRARFSIPFEPRPYQTPVIERLAPLPRAGYYLDVGTGKTFTATISALFKMMNEGRRVMVLMPPILMPMWGRWFSKISGLRVLSYVGAPKKRRHVSFDNADVVLMPITIFKNDWDEVVARCSGSWTLIVDEAASIKNVATDNHKAVFAFISTVDAHLMLLTGTPLTVPLDGYAYIKLVAPGTYRNLNQFENLHIEARDFFKTPVKWKNLELLAENLKINSARLLKTDVLKDLPKVQVTTLNYSLAPAHTALYKTIAEEQLVKLESGGKIDATSVSALYHALGQLVMNYGYFADDPSKVSVGVELIEEVLAELGEAKLVVFSNYRLTNELLFEKLGKHNPVLVYGGVSRAEQTRNIDRFITDPSCRVFLGQPSSAGVGLDGLQAVCQDMIFMEMPTTPAAMEQAVGRLFRQGQTGAVHVRVGVAEGTLQGRQLDALLAKETLVGRVVRSPEMLRASVFGE